MSARADGARARLGTLALALASLAVFFGGCELLTRLVDLRARPAGSLANPPWLGERWLLPRADYREQLAAHGLLTRYYDLYRWDRYLIYALRPGRDLALVDPLAPSPSAEGARWHVRTNAQGFRTAGFTPRPAPGVKRVLALGDSSTFGWGVDAPAAWASRLAQALARRRAFGGAPVEVLNLGVPGYSTHQGRVMLERVALPLAPDAIVWSYIANDGQVTGAADAELARWREGPLGALLAALHRSRAFETWESWLQSLRGGAAPAPETAVRNVASYDVALANARAAFAAARDAGVPLVALALCARDDVAGVLARAAEAEGARFVPASGILDQLAPRIASEPRFAEARRQLEARWGAAALAAQPLLHTYLPDGCHPNEVGHRLVAQLVADALLATTNAPEREEVVK